LSARKAASATKAPRLRMPEAQGAELGESIHRFKGLRGVAAPVCAEMSRIAGYFTQNRWKIPVVT
jgi:hypothetical protein